MDSKIRSTREPLGTLDEKNMLEKVLRRIDAIPGPGTYDLNFAIGRHVANDFKFGLLKSDQLRNVSYILSLFISGGTHIPFQRDKKNKEQVVELRKLLGANDLFTDKRACRRMAHLALYHQ
ncbi:hypothetical protein HDU96_003929 [Phlyctochytrium bullatum]|nr:hypothetical protein HDU96_003929 [Phlyctochytrium bullatum]